ncbi:polysaccharide pyruvyl transferase family protein [Metabacillus sp. GX 13764]|uniref:polysaccharide pyruvyl transferase family protein n=1 Tax=Metabacillus kandeliae TaxID=2900151 RepID=UPI001E47FCB3|nr:polysaccharide pyruvyl transferase family protein [Metabacillus kandeliae]MCD7033150.1 polysaccharide pyruvyl transferase family protein [Metabacillus kandeliae]
MKIMMFAHDGSQNRGCEAIVRSSAKIIKEKSNKAEIFLSSGRPETDKIITHLDKINDGSAKDIKRYSYDWFVSTMRYKLFKDESYALSKIHKNIIQQINEADICLSIGGDNYCYGEQPGWYEIDRRIKRKNKKLVLWACSIGEQDLSEQKLEDLKMFDLILARESITYQTLLDKGLSNVKLCADPAFTMEKEELPLPKGWKKGKTLGLNFSPLVLSKNKESETAVYQLIEHILSTTDLTIALTPHVIKEKDNDFKLLYEYYQKFKQSDRVLILPDNLTAPQYKGYISRMKFFVGARTHATIAAYSSHVPTLVLGYSVKSKGIAKDLFGEEKYVLGINELSDSDKLRAEFNHLLENEEDIKKSLEKSIPQIKKMSYKAVDYLNEIEI